MGYTKVLSYNETMEGMSEIFPDVVYSHAGGEELTMQLIVPWWDRIQGEIPAFPLVVFIQGSSWTLPNVWYEIPQLCELSKKGYVVASLVHRNSMEGHPFPACLEDVKTAIRFLRKNAKVYGIDAEHVGIFGTSSGGNLALLTAMTMGDEKYETEEHAGYSEKVNFCAACFPPANLPESMLDETFDPGLKEIFGALSGGSVDREMSVLKEMSPYHIVDGWIKSGEKKELPPIFLAHGDEDLLIPYKQSADLYEKLLEYGAEVSFVTVEHAPHEERFWSREMFELIFEFIEKNIR